LRTLKICPCVDGHLAFPHLAERFPIKPEVGRQATAIP
jgi:hypothetical protein